MTNVNGLGFNYGNPSVNPKASDCRQKALEEALLKVEDLGDGKYLIPTHTVNGEVTETKEVDKAGLVRYLKLQTTMLKGSSASKLERTPGEDKFEMGAADSSDKPAYPSRPMFKPFANPILSDDGSRPLYADPYTAMAYNLKDSVEDIKRMKEKGLKGYSEEEKAKFKKDPVNYIINNMPVQAYDYGNI